MRELRSEKTARTDRLNIIDETGVYRLERPNCPKMSKGDCNCRSVVVGEGKQSMENGLIGYSGFVGSNLCRQVKFDRKYNSQKFREMEGRNFGLLVCAGVSAAKWIANREPEEDVDVSESDCCARHGEGPRILVNLNHRCLPKPCRRRKRNHYN